MIIKDYFAFDGDSFYSFVRAEYYSPDGQVRLKRRHLYPELFYRCATKITPEPFRQSNWTIVSGNTLVLVDACGTELVGSNNL